MLLNVGFNSSALFYFCHHLDLQVAADSAADIQVMLDDLEKENRALREQVEELSTHTVEKAASDTSFIHLKAKEQVGTSSLLFRC